MAEFAVTPELLADSAFDLADFQGRLGRALAGRLDAAIGVLDHSGVRGMTHEDWLTSPEPRRLLEHLGLPPVGQVVLSLPRRHPLASARKLRLLAIAVARHCGCGLWASVGHLIAAAYRMADGEGHGLSEQELELVEMYVASWLVAASSTSAARYIFSHYQPDPQDGGTGPAQADLIRCVMGDVFEPVLLGRECPDCGGSGKRVERPVRQVVDDYGHWHDLKGDPVEVYCKHCLGDGRVGRRDWLTPDVLAVARAVYAEHRWGDLPILADALTDASCDDERILGHLRNGGPHGRGCWVVDLVLGKG